jgi:hypothetical protein
VLQVALNFPPQFTGHFATTAAEQHARTERAWAAVARLVPATKNGLLEMVQATGDTFMLAGAFSQQSDDALRLKAALGMLRFLHDLRRELAGLCSYTAVATAGPAYGALLGASLLTFRLFGAAVREGDAMLAAAPIALPGVSVAFATEGFRRQARNYIAPRVRAGVAGSNGGMSVALKSTVLDESMAGGVSPTPPSAAQAEINRPGGTESDVEQGSTFSAPMQWRVRGVGVAMISIIKS